MSVHDFINICMANIDFWLHLDLKSVELDFDLDWVELDYIRCRSL